MKEDILDAISDAGAFADDEKTQAIMHCVDVIDYLHEAASKIVVNFILTQPCDRTQAFSNLPEVLAIQAMQTAIRQVACGSRRPDEAAH